MKQLMAELKVYVDMDRTDMPSGVVNDGRGNFTLVMYPNQACVPAKTREEFQTVMAHELGHFIAIVTQDPTHGQRRNVMFRQIDNPTPADQLPGERKAWELAEKINPDLNKKIAADCIGSYEKGAAEWDSLSPFERMMTQVVNADDSAYQSNSRPSRPSRLSRLFRWLPWHLENYSRATGLVISYVVTCLAMCAFAEAFAFLLSLLEACSHAGH